MFQNATSLEIFVCFFIYIYPLALRANPATVPGVKLVRLVKLVKLVTLSISNQTKIDQHRPQNRPKIDPKSTKNRPRSTKNRAWMGPGGHLGPKVAPGADLTPKPWFVGPPGPPKLGAKIVQKSSKNRSQTQHVFRSLFWSILEPSWGRFGRILGPKMEPKLVQNRSQERSWSKCKNHQKPFVLTVLLRIRGAWDRSKIALKTMLS